MATNISCENDLGNLMMATNHEAKAIVLGGMEEGHSYGAAALHKELFLAPQGEPPAHVGSPSNQLDYCTLSFEPAGVVRRAPVVERQFMLTGTGNNEGKALAGHVLALSLETEDIGLRAIYGMARTGKDKGSRPPLDRLRIFRLLLDSDDVRAADVRAELEVSASTAVNNLNWLDRDGIIEYQAVNSSDLHEHMTYGLPDSFTPYANGGGMRQRIQEAVESLIAEGARDCSATELMDFLNKTYPGDGFDTAGRRNYALDAMNELVEGRYVTKGPIDGAHKSKAVLRQTARPVIERTVAIADGMLSGDPSFLQEGRAQLRGILADEVRVRQLITKAYRASPEASRIPRQQKFDHIGKFLEGGEASTSRITAELERRGMTPAATKRTLALMRDEGLLVSRRIADSREFAWSRP